MSLALILVSLLGSPSAQAAEPGVITRMVQSLGSEVDLFADCERNKKKPLLLASSGGTVRQIAMKCHEAAGNFDVYLSYQPKGGEPKKDYLKEVFLRATNPEAEAMLAKLTDQIASEAGEHEIAFVKYRLPTAVMDLTVSLQGFSWGLLSGASYYEKLKSQADRQSSVVLTELVALKVPTLGKVDVAVTTFSGDDGTPMTTPGWSIVHLLRSDGTVQRFPLRLPAVPGGQTATLSPFPISAEETVMKYQGPSESSFFRLDAEAKKLSKLGLTERATEAKGSETRYALMPSANTAGPYYAFDLVRVEVKRDAAGNVRGTTEKVMGTCTYEIARQDFVCPALR